MRHLQGIVSRTGVALLFQDAGDAQQVAQGTGCRAGNEQATEGPGRNAVDALHTVELVAGPGVAEIPTRPIQAKAANKPAPTRALKTLSATTPLAERLPIRLSRKSLRVIRLLQTAAAS
jgi:hypothetical protein